jgi:thiamine-monophosphate kinase
MKAKRQLSKAIPLRDIGESNLIQRIKALVDRNCDTPFVLDDAAPVWVKGCKGRLLVTTDPAPFPCLVQRLGMGTAYHTGWLVVVKSLSDLAAAGATPIGVTIAAEFCPATTVEEFDEFFKGAVDCAVQHGTRLVGGNIKEVSDRKHAVAFAIGSHPNDYSLSRAPSEPGDQILIVDGNDWAAFWAGIAAHKHPRIAGRLPAKVWEYVRERALRPKAQIIAGNILAKTRAVVFAMDTSDGLLATALQLAKNADCAVHLEVNASSMAEPVRSLAKALNADPRVWALGWGSCELLFTCRPSDVSRIKRELHRHGIKCVTIGEVRKGSPHVFVDEGDHEHCIYESPFLRGEQFHRDSIWNLGLDKYIDIMLRSSLAALMTTQNSGDL